ncbi:L-ascorbate metabolism protein UlaG (beta-lactamase superfamily) [Marinoscillum furvescens DSM 4134]|uniref:L-ascorbate metabolism protein UlaG (Beta-lactamase superfamily) n=2 Tax=Marinoscillum furvescens TaxID=1026 RepID=A0A3D9KX35_MARFU|nr:L-ascorbate metabolism protein UlaG (beta-lactamase superfamily) [Marinoscillum furvescens DSM 4134]
MWTAITIVALLTMLIAGTFIFVSVSPEFGQPPKGEDLTRIKQSPNYGTKGFVNLIETSTGEIWDALKATPEMFKDGGRNPARPIPVAFEKESPTVDSLTYVTWYGHSAFLLETSGQRILIDPMLGKVASPTSFGTKRFTYATPIPLEELQDIDVVIISHDHYDHLDYPTIKLLKDQVGRFITPLGIGSHLKSWGVPADRITELDWWQETSVGAIHYVACPSRHFSGRGLTDRDATQWASWVILTEKEKIYFSGDGGYGAHFSEIGLKYGPFDFAMLECGQYNEAWSNIHMMPEESVQAGLDVNARLAMPIHWGAFRLAPHSWVDPIQRFTKAADQHQLPYILPTIGDRFVLGQEYPKSEWWTQAM